MNINEEGKYYASMVRKYRSEYGGKNLTGFCRDQKVSYTKMLHCLRNESYQRLETSESQNENTDEESGLHPLVIDREDNAQEKDTELSEPVHYERQTWLCNVDITFSSRIKVRIGRCYRSDLVSLIKEMEGTAC